jgi:hypothetical protein
MRSQYAGHVLSVAMMLRVRTLWFFLLLNYRVISCERTSWTSVFPLQDSFYQHQLPGVGERDCDEHSSDR